MDEKEKQVLGELQETLRLVNTINKTLKSMNERLEPGGEGYTSQQLAVDSVACWKEMFGVNAQPPS